MPFFLVSCFCFSHHSFTITDDIVNSKFIIEAAAEVCLEAHSTCLIKVILANPIIVSKPFCNMEQGFQIQGILVQIQQYLNGKKITKCVYVLIHVFICNHNYNLNTSIHMYIPGKHHCVVILQIQERQCCSFIHNRFFSSGLACH